MAGPVFESEQEYLSSAVHSRQVDYGKASNFYAEHRPGFPQQFYDRLELLGVEFKGKKVLDLGSGPGVIALELAKRGATEVVGTDISAGQIEAANQLAQKFGLQDKCKFKVAPSEETGLPEKYFDAVTAGTCWHWFDNEKACKEVRRVLKPGGLLIAANYVYVGTEDKLAGDTEQLIYKYNPAYPIKPQHGLQHDLITKLVTEGKFEFLELFCFDYAQPFSHESWVKRMLTHSGVASGEMSEEQVKNFSDDVRKLLADHPATVHIKHRVYAVIVRN